MKKVDLFLLLTYVVAALFASYLTLSLPLSVISKVICLTWCWFVSLSVVSLVILESRDTWNTTRQQAGSNRLATLAKKEAQIVTKQQTGQTTTTSKRDIADYKNFLEEW